MNDLAASLAKEFATIAQDQGLISNFTIHSNENIECLLVGASEAISLPGLEMGYFLKGVISGARIQRFKGGGG